MDFVMNGILYALPRNLAEQQCHAHIRVTRQSQNLMLKSKDLDIGVNVAADRSIRG
jgi:hypothetical protein